MCHWRMAALLRMLGPTVKKAGAYSFPCDADVDADPHFCAEAGRTCVSQSGWHRVSFCTPKLLYCTSSSTGVYYYVEMPILSWCFLPQQTLTIILWILLALLLFWTRRGGIYDESVRLDAPLCLMTLRRDRRSDFEEDFTEAAAVVLIHYPSSVELRGTEGGGYTSLSFSHRIMWRSILAWGNKLQCAVNYMRCLGLIRHSNSTSESDNVLAGWFFSILGRIAAVAAELHITAHCDDSTNAQSLSRHTSRKSKKKRNRWKLS